MRYFFFSLILTLQFSVARAQELKGISIETKVTAVTVFQQSAQVTRTGSKQIPAGNQTLYFPHITQNMDPSSIQLKGKGNLTILSIAHKSNFLGEDDKSDRMRDLENKIEEISDKITALKGTEDAYNKERDMILANQRLGGNNTGFSLQELQQTADFFRKRIAEINTQTESIRKEVKELSVQQQKYQQQLNQERQAFARKTSLVEVKVEAKSATTASFELSYLVSNAGWQSIYDARVEDLKSPVKLVQKARVVQQTGENWNEVDLRLNTGNPRMSGQVPYLSTWYIDYPQQYFIDGVKSRGNVDAAKQYKPQAEAQLNEMADQADDIGNQEFQLTQGLTQEEYSISKKQTIPSSGNPEVVQLRELDLQAQYEYHLKPRMDKDAFLVALVYDWDQYNLLPGELSLFNGNTYIGESYLNTQNSGDTIELSLGRDQSIITTRTRVRSKEDKSFLGSKKVEQFTWKIEVRNSKNVAVMVILKEALPVSRNSEIQVEIEELSGGKQDVKPGVIKWQFKLEPEARKELIVSYQVKYPKDKTVVF